MRVGGPSQELACSGCGLILPDGTRGCRAMFDELAIRQWDAPVAYRLRRMMVDTYSLQHPSEFCASAKSLAAHLTGLCVALEHQDHPTILEVLLAWLESRPTLERPAVPTARGEVTIAESFAAPDAGRLVASADRWARAVWEAYTPLHPLARRWIEAALSRPANRPRR